MFRQKPPMKCSFLNVNSIYGSSMIIYINCMNHLMDATMSNSYPSGGLCFFLAVRHRAQYGPCDLDLSVPWALMKKYKNSSQSNKTILLEKNILDYP